KTKTPLSSLSGFLMGATSSCGTVCNKVLFWPSFPGLSYDCRRGHSLLRADAKSNNERKFVGNQSNLRNSAESEIAWLWISISGFESLGGSQITSSSSVTCSPSENPVSGFVACVWENGRAGRIIVFVTVRRSPRLLFLCLYALFAYPINFSDSGMTGQL